MTTTKDDTFFFFLINITKDDTSRWQFINFSNSASKGHLGKEIVVNRIWKPSKDLRESRSNAFSWRRIIALITIQICMKSSISLCACQLQVLTMRSILLQGWRQEEELKSRSLTEKRKPLLSSHLEREV